MRAIQNRPQDKLVVAIKKDKGKRKRGFGSIEASKLLS